MDPWKQFMKDFEYFLEEWLNKKEEIILGIDVNEANLLTTEIQQLARQLDLIDVHHHMHGGTQAPSTYQQGKHQLDFTFISPGILPSLLTAGFLPFNILFKLDHQTIYADFDSAILFNSECNNPIDSSKQ
eukprot:15348310-Ditylum_brightwellii.AAC.1